MVMGIREQLEQVSGTLKELARPTLHIAYPASMQRGEVLRRKDIAASENFNIGSRILQERFASSMSHAWKHEFRDYLHGVYFSALEMIAGDCDMPSLHPIPNVSILIFKSSSYEKHNCNGGNGNDFILRSLVRAIFRKSIIMNIKETYLFKISN